MTTGGSKRSLWLPNAETRNLLISVLSATVVSFIVTYYTAQRADRSQRQDARVAQLTAIYTPLETTTTELLTCLRPD